MLEPVIGVVVGLVSAYVLLSMICSAINEWIAQFRAGRSRTLEGGIRCLLGEDETGRYLTEQFYCHPLIAGFAKPGWFDRTFRNSTSLPSYIPPRTFALALFDIVAALPAPPAVVNTGPPVTAATGTAAGVPAGVGGPIDGVAIAPPSGGSQSMIKLRAGLNRLGESQAGKALRVLLEEVGDDRSSAFSPVQTWFTETMERVSGQYKRVSQLTILVVALVVTVGLNVDTFEIAEGLWADTESAAQAEDTGTPSLIGWSDRPAWDDLSLTKIAGLLLTVLAISLGAPVWFDLLSKVVNLRTTGMPPTTATTTTTTTATDGTGTGPNG